MHRKISFDLNKQTLGILFTFLYVMAMLRPLTPLFIYYVNYDYIAAELCENRDRPYIDCNGVCYLNTMVEELDSQSGGENPISTVPLNMNDYPISTLDFFQYNWSSQIKSKELIQPIFCKNFIINEYETDIFRPPKLA